MSPLEYCHNVPKVVHLLSEMYIDIISAVRGALRIEKRDALMGRRESPHCPPTLVWLYRDQSNHSYRQSLLTATLRREMNVLPTTGVLIEIRLNSRNT